MKISELAEPKAIRVFCEPDEWADAMKALVDKAEKTGIIPSIIAIVCKDDQFDIILWGG